MLVKTAVGCERGAGPTKNGKHLVGKCSREGPQGASIGEETD